MRASPTPRLTSSTQIHRGLRPPTSSGTSSASLGRVLNGIATMTFPGQGKSVLFAPFSPRTFALLTAILQLCYKCDRYRAAGAGDHRVYCVPTGQYRARQSRGSKSYTFVTYSLSSDLSFFSSRRCGMPSTSPTPGCVTRRCDAGMATCSWTAVAPPHRGSWASQRGKDRLAGKGWSCLRPSASRVCLRSRYVSHPACWLLFH